MAIRRFMAAMRSEAPLRQITMEHGGRSRPVVRWVPLGAGLVLAAVFWAVRDVQVVVPARFAVQAGAAYAVHPPEDGTITEILVREGDWVEPGTALLRFRAAKETAARQQHEMRMADLLSRSARISAFLDGSAPDFSAIAPVYGDMVRDQMTLLRAKNRSRQEGLQALDDQIQEKKEEITVLEQELRTSRRMTSMNALLASEQAHLLTGAQRAHRGDGTKSSPEAEAQRLERFLERRMVGRKELEERRQTLEATLRQQARADLETIATELAVLRERMAGLPPGLLERIVRAPVRGRVRDRRAGTIGRTVQPQDTLLEIATDGDRLRLEARINPRDLDSVQIGQTVTVHVDPAVGWQGGPLKGRLVKRSTYPRMDGGDDLPYFPFSIELDPSALDETAARRILVSGVTAEARIATGQRPQWSRHLANRLTQAPSPAFGNNR
jgi:HlyD family type I secretion membrane fusion protein